MPSNRGKSTRERPVLERFWEKVDASGDCWEWTAARKPAGYGNFSIWRGLEINAHRFAWITLVGPIPKGYELDHLCRNRACVNPDHLEPVTKKENNRRSYSLSALNARKTHCKRGHLLAPPNLRKNTKGQRICRTCSLEYQQSRRAA